MFGSCDSETVPLALEAGQLGAEGGQTSRRCSCSSRSAGSTMPVVGALRAARRRPSARSAASAPSTWSAKNDVGVVDDLVPGGEVVQPVDGERGSAPASSRMSSVVGRRPVRMDFARTASRAARNRLARARRARPRCLPGSARAAASSSRAVARRRVRRVVDEQHDAQVRVLLQGRRQQRRPDDPLVLLVGGHQHGHLSATGWSKKSSRTTREARAGGRGCGRRSRFG